MTNTHNILAISSKKLLLVFSGLIILLAGISAASAVEIYTQDIFAEDAVECPLLWEYLYDNHEDSITCTEISYDGTHVVSGSKKGQVLLLAAESGKLISERLLDSKINSIAVSHDGRYTAAATAKGNLYYLDESLTIIWRIYLGSSIYAAAMTPDASMIIVGSSEGHLEAYSGSGDPVWKNKLSKGINTIAVSSDGNLIAAGYSTDELLYYDRSGTQTHDIFTDSSSRSISVSDDGTKIGTACVTKGIFIYNEDGTLTKFIPCGYTPLTISLSADGRYAAAGFDDDTIRIYNTETGNMTAWFKEPSKINSLSISNSGKRLSAGSDDGYVRYLDVSELIKPAETAVPTPVPTERPIIPNILIVKSSPDGASVEIDGAPAGLTPFKSEGIRPGNHNIVIKLDGYKTWKTDISFGLSGQESTINALLNKNDDEGLPLLLIAGTAAVIAAAAIFIIRQINKRKYSNKDWYDKWY